MTDEINEQISAFFDDELSAEESAFLVRRLESDPEARKQFSRYATIGSALRGELIDVDAAVLRGRIQASLSGAAPAWSPIRPSTPAAKGMSKWAAGFGLAAVVAFAALVGLRNINQALSDSPSAADSGAASSIDGLEASYVVPPDVPEDRIVTPAGDPPVRLTNYLMQHGSFASILTRTSVHSNVVTIRDNEPEIATESQPEGPGEDR